MKLTATENSRLCTTVGTAYFRQYKIVPRTSSDDTICWYRLTFPQCYICGRGCLTDRKVSLVAYKLTDYGLHHRVLTIGVGFTSCCGDGMQINLLIHFCNHATTYTNTPKLYPYILWMYFLYYVETFKKHV